jgi:hypothetical protein
MQTSTRFVVHQLPTVNGRTPFKFVFENQAARKWLLHQQGHLKKKHATWSVDQDLPLLARRERAAHADLVKECKSLGAVVHWHWTEPRVRGQRADLWLADKRRAQEQHQQGQGPQQQQQQQQSACYESRQLTSEHCVKHNCSSSSSTRCAGPQICSSTCRSINTSAAAMLAAASHGW